MNGRLVVEPRTSWTWCRHCHTSWEQRATQNPDRIRRAWSNRPYGIGIACGPSRLLVIDTDVPKPDQPPASSDRPGEDVLAELVGDRPFPETYTVSTPSGGIHRYFRTPTQAHLGNTASRLGELIDTRGHGGYVLAAPTVIEDRLYRVLRDKPCAELPTWLIHLLKNPHRIPHLPPSQMARYESQLRVGLGTGLGERYAAAALAGETARVRTAPPGTRNHTLFSVAIALGQLVAGGLMDEATVRDHLRAACTNHVGAGAFSASEVDATITSGLTRGLAEPRTPAGRSAP